MAFENKIFLLTLMEAPYGGFEELRQRFVR